MLLSTVRSAVRNVRSQSSVASVARIELPSLDTVHAVVFLTFASAFIPAFDPFNRPATARVQQCRKGAVPYTRTSLRACYALIHTLRSHGYTCTEPLQVTVRDEQSVVLPTGATLYLEVGECK